MRTPGPVRFAPGPGRSSGIAWIAAVLLATAATQRPVVAGVGPQEVRAHWAYGPLDRTPPPERAVAAGVRNDVDRYVGDRLDSRGLTAAVPADHRTLIRRLYIDLIGLPPTPEAVARNVAAANGDWYEDLVDELLASPRYGERWARHWLDVVRYADTHGFETNTPRDNAFPYRDWVIDAFNRDLPYDRFVLEQLAGDAVGRDAATGFLVAGPWDSVKSPDPKLTAEQRSGELADMVDSVGASFLATTVGCARCHDHKFDPVSQREFYALEAVFAGVQHGERPLPTADDETRTARIAAIDARLAAIDAGLAARAPIASLEPVLLIDDESAASGTDGLSVVDVLHERSGHGQNPGGRARGQAEDPGDLERLPNLSGGRYSWWRNVPGADVVAWRPGVEGRYRLWVSWGCGYATHSTDARYVLDIDGDLATRGDRRVIARVDQQRFADGSGTVDGAPLWSGFADLGFVELRAASRLVLACGEAGTAVTADVIALRRDDGVGTAASRVPPLREPVDARLSIDRFAPRVARFVRLTVDATDRGSEPCIDELEVWSAAGPGAPPRNVALAASGAVATASSALPGYAIHQVAHLNDGLVGNDHSWISNEAGRGIAVIELADAAVIDRVVWGRDRDGRLEDRLATSYRIEVAATDGAWVEVASSGDRAPYAGAAARPVVHLPLLSRGGDDGAVALGSGIQGDIDERIALHAERAELARRPVGYVGRFERPGPTRRLHRGDPTDPREVVAPGAVAALGGPLELAVAAPEQERRLALARWLTGPAAPLLARVMVNRLWQHHFGVGLCATPSDFGRNGAEPSHPRLLDRLAAELIDSGWSIKHVQRLIVTSATYRQSSAPDAAACAVDADSRLLWRFPPRRVEAEVIRDAILAVAGTLDVDAAGGPGFDVFEPDTNYVRVYEPKRSFGPAEWRRAVYARHVRMEKDMTFGAFDCPDGGRATPRRARSTTALQALNLLNSPFVLQQAEMFAARVRREAGGDPAAMVWRAFGLALQREPDADELRAGRELVAEHGLAALCRALFQVNEFVFVE